MNEGPDTVAVWLARLGHEKPEDLDTTLRYLLMELYMRREVAEARALGYETVDFVGRLGP